MSALAVARLCAQTAQDAIYGFCPLCSRSDAGTVASLTDPGPGPVALSRSSPRADLRVSLSPRVVPRPTLRDALQKELATPDFDVFRWCAILRRVHPLRRSEPVALVGGHRLVWVGLRVVDALHGPSVRRRSSSLMLAGRGRARLGGPDRGSPGVNHRLMYVPRYKPTSIRVYLHA